MKKSYVLAASLLATTAFAGDALALNATAAGYNGAPRQMVIPGAGLAGYSDAMIPIGPAVGALGQGCGLILSWRNPLTPLNPKFTDNRLCTLVETTALGQGCGIDQTANIPAFVTSFGNVCTGFNQGGLAQPANLALAELPVGAAAAALVGTVSYFGGAVVLPIGPF